MDIEYRFDRNVPHQDLIKFYQDSSYNQWWAERNVQASLDYCYLFATAWADGQLIGTLVLHSDEVNFAFIDEIVIHTDFRGKGIGTTLLNEALRKIQELKVDFVQLIPIPGRESFFARAGFKVIPDHQVMEL